MPFINGRFYMNPAYGRGVEDARASDIEPEKVPANAAEAGHGITIAHRHIFIQEEQQSQPTPPKLFSGDATYYNLPGSKTASGSKFDPNHMAAAMTAEKVKLGQRVIVTYTHHDENGKMVTRSISVLVNDRGPFARDANGKPRIPLQPDPAGVIDLTPAAFRKLVGSTKSGRVHVTVAVPNE